MINPKDTVRTVPGASEQADLFGYRPLIWHRPRRAKRPEPDKHKDRREQVKAAINLFIPQQRKREKKTAQLQ
jgi:hypothetical protein